MVSLVEWVRGLIGPTVKTRLLDLLDLESRLAADDRRATRELIIDMQELNEKQHQATVQLVSALATSVTEQGKSFNRYLDLVTPNGEPSVRPMNDQLEAEYEKKWLSERGPSGEESEGAFDTPIVTESQMGEDLMALVRSIG